MAAETKYGGNALITAYFNEKAAIWDETIAEKDVTKLEDMARRLDIKSSSTVLDVGTGTGVFVPFLLDKNGGNGRLICLDPAEDMLKRAQAKGFQGNIEYICADIADNRLDNETFDTVVCYSSFPHFQDKPGALGEINRVLKKGGRLFICHTSSRTAINEIHSQILEVQNDLIPEEDEMQQLLSSAGFTEISICDDNSSYLASACKCDRHLPT
ncbi:class I SAM-dependent methyltransferase [Chloroflexota bacterium]